MTYYCVNKNNTCTESICDSSERKEKMELRVGYSQVVDLVLTQLFSTNTCVYRVQIHVYIEYKYMCIYSTNTCVYRVQIHVYTEYKYMCI